MNGGSILLPPIFKSSNQIKMSIAVKVLDYLQENPELLNEWYNNKITSGDVYDHYIHENKECRYYLIGNESVDYYNEGYEDEHGQQFTGIEAVIEASEGDNCCYEKFEEEVGVTTIHQFSSAIDGQDWIIISKEEYDQI